MAAGLVNCRRLFLIMQFPDYSSEWNFNELLNEMSAKNPTGWTMIQRNKKAPASQNRVLPPYTDAELGIDGRYNVTRGIKCCQECYASDGRLYIVMGDQLCTNVNFSDESHSRCKINNCSFKHVRIDECTSMSGHFCGDFRYDDKGSKASYISYLCIPVCKTHTGQGGVCRINVSFFNAQTGKWNEMYLDAVHRFCDTKHTKHTKTIIVSQSAFWADTKASAKPHENASWHPPTPLATKEKDEPSASAGTIVPGVSGGSRPAPPTLPNYAIGMSPSTGKKLCTFASVAGTTPSSKEPPAAIARAPPPASPQQETELDLDKMEEAAKKRRLVAERRLAIAHEERRAQLLELLAERVRLAITPEEVSLHIQEMLTHDPTRSESVSSSDGNHALGELLSPIYGRDSPPLTTFTAVPPAAGAKVSD
jgi:hypothetical protein